MDSCLLDWTPRSWSSSCVSHSRHSGVEKLPSINELYEFISSSFDFTKSRGFRFKALSFKDRALAVAGAFVHLKIQGRTFRGERTARGRTKAPDLPHRLLLSQLKKEDAAVKDLNQAMMGLSRLAFSDAWTHPSQTPSVRSTQVPHTPVVFIAA